MSHEDGPLCRHRNVDVVNHALAVQYFLYTAAGFLCNSTKARMIFCQDSRNGLRVPVLVRSQPARSVARGTHGTDADGTGLRGNRSNDGALLPHARLFQTHDVFESI